MRLLFFLIISGIINSCSPSLQKQFLTNIVGIASLEIPQAYDRISPCNNKLNYIPDTNHLDHTPVKYIKMNFHYMLTKDGWGNFREERGRNYIRQIMYYSNNNLKGENSKMNLPPGNNTPVIQTHYQYKLTPNPKVPRDDGIYFHYDDELYFMNASKSKDRNVGSKEVYDKYGVQKDSVMNVFIMAFPRDSMDSPTFKAGQHGVAFGNWVKVLGWYTHATDTIWKDDGTYNLPYGAWFTSRVLRHEIGHCLGLVHTWKYDDGCDDTPKNPGCWAKTPSGPCHTQWSNNVMDYNTYQSAWTPCQIGRSHYAMSIKNRKIRKVLEKTWCKLDEKQTINIEDDIVWNSAKDLNGHVVVKDSATLTIRCRLALPRMAKIIVYPRGKLILDGATLENDCGDQWQGIEIWSFGNDKGEVVFHRAPVINNAINNIIPSGDLKSSQ